jgi:hypothetical protein
MLAADAANTAGAGGGPAAVPGLHCNNSNFSVDSLMTVAGGREGAGSPEGRLSADMAASYQQQQHYSACLYHGSSLDELGGGLPQGLLSPPPPPYSRPSWYAMPNGGEGSQSPTGGGGVDHSGLVGSAGGGGLYAAPRDYFEPLGGGAKAPSPGPCAQYRTPPYRTYYSQDCDKY